MSDTIRSIQYPFAIDPGMGTLMEQTDYATHVQQLMMQILFTNPGERINRPDFGCGLRRMIFAPNSIANASMLKVLINQSLEKYLSTLISVIDVETSAVDEVLSVRISYILTAFQQQQYLNLEVTL